MVFKTCDPCLSTLLATAEINNLVSNLYLYSATQHALEVRLLTIEVTVEARAGVVVDGTRSIVRRVEAPVVMAKK